MLKTRRIAMRLGLVVTGAAALLSAYGMGRAATPPDPHKGGLVVRPGGLLIQDVVPGETYDLKAKAGVALTIFNREEREHTYALSTRRPTEMGNRALPPGYADLPDPSWVAFDKDEVSVPARSSAEIGIRVTIPADERYFNQHWSVVVVIASKAKPGSMVSLAVLPRFEIETAAAARGTPPAGRLGLQPTKVALSGADGNNRLRGQFVVHNGDAVDHEYRFAVLPRGRTARGAFIHATSGFTWMPKTIRVVLADSRLRVAAGQSVAVPFQVISPRGIAVPPGGWEAIILVTGADRTTAFVRVQVTP